MYTNKLTRKDKEDKLIRLKRIKDIIEFDPNKTHPESKKHISSWKVFIKLQPYEQAKIRQEWDKYYLEVKQTPIYLMLQAQREAFKVLHSNSADSDEKERGRMRFAEIAKETQLMRENGDINTLPKPNSIDPWEYNRNWVKAYLDCEQEIKDLNNELNTPESEELQEVWG